MDTNRQLEERIRELSEELDEMRGRMNRLEGKDGTNGEGRQDRRGFLRLAAGAAIGAAGLAAGKVLPAAATDGDTVTTGHSFTEETSLFISDDSTNGTAVPVFGAKAKTFSSSAQTTAGTFFGPLQGLGGSGGTDPNLNNDVPVEGVDGWASGFKAFGVYGLTDSGVGVAGESSTGVGLYARSSGRIVQDLRGSAGKPNFTGNDGEMVRDANGAMWISIPASVSAVGWVQMAAMTLFADPRRVYNDTTNQPAATYGPIDATTKYNGGATGVPAGASAAFCAVQSYSAGVMTLYPDGASDPGIANWSGVANGPLNLLYMFVPLSTAGKFKMHTYFTGKRYVDVWGFIF